MPDIWVQDARSATEEACDDVLERGVDLPTMKEATKDVEDVEEALKEMKEVEEIKTSRIKVYIDILSFN